ncbi:MAG TPA: HAD family phosphatase [Candidatus Dormibacteraeota bacterium]|nr:HAD family phosphatase [Candidatus Dormibacteraeota bacterium]
MIEALIFDYGGVISDGGRGFEPAFRLAKNLGIEEQDALDLIQAPWDKLSTGTINTGEFWNEIETGYGDIVPGNLRDIWNTYENCMKPRGDMQNVLQALKSSGYILGLVSNTVPPTAQSIRNNGGYDFFDFTVLSCEVGFKKPDTKIYELGLNQVGDITPEHIVYIDDANQNLPAAQKLGMKTIHANNHNVLINELSAMLKGK